jgi:hypothetical protein
MPVTRRQITMRGLRCQCPNCGGRLVFGRRMRLIEDCPHPGCGLRWWRGEGFFLGAMVWNYGVTVFGLLAPITLACYLGWLRPSVAVALALLAAVVFPWVFYKLSWSLWLASYYFFLPHELPANAGADFHPPIDDEA